MTRAKRLQKEIKKLARIAHEKEMNHYLEFLDQKFSDWKSGKINSWDLVQHIHGFHNGQSKDLYNSYQQFPSDSFVIRAIARGYCDVDELPQELREEFRNKAEILKA